jgi:hypothetical protein
MLYIALPFKHPFLRMQPFGSDSFVEVSTEHARLQKRKQLQMHLQGEGAGAGAGAASAGADFVQVSKPKAAFWFYTQKMTPVVQEDGFKQGKEVGVSSHPRTVYAPN